MCQILDAVALRAARAVPDASDEHIVEHDIAAFVKHGSQFDHIGLVSMLTDGELSKLGDGELSKLGAGDGDGVGSGAL